ncbi:MAG TPA: hypothetical protein VJM79_07410 [Rhizorhapis sp.]|nr:hypothetical protein [Rhizorhapis sp.]
MRNIEMPRWPEDAEDIVSSQPNLGGLLAGLPDSDTGSSLHLLMEPRDIAAVPGLPQYVYDEAAKYDQKSLAAKNGEATGYVSNLDRVSLAPPDWNSSGLDLSAPAPRPPGAKPQPEEKYQQASKAAKYFSTGIDRWNDQNEILGLHFGAEGPRFLKKYSGPIGTFADGLGNGFAAASEIEKGAPALPTYSGAAIRTGIDWGAVALGTSLGAALGTRIFGAPYGTVGGGIGGGFIGGFVPDWAHGRMSNQELGETVLEPTGSAYNKYVIHNPYYDPRLMVP